MLIYNCVALGLQSVTYDRGRGVVRMYDPTSEGPFLGCIDSRRFLQLKCKYQVHSFKSTFRDP